MTEQMWYEDRDNLLGLAEWMDSECCFIDTSSVIRFFEKPWKWVREYELWKIWKDSQVPDVQQLCVEGLCDYDITAESVQNAYDWVE